VSWNINFAKSNQINSEGMPLSIEKFQGSYRDEAINIRQSLDIVFHHNNT